MTEQSDRSADPDPPAAYESQRTRSGRQVKATQHRCKARRLQAGEMAFQGHRGRWVSINQEGKESCSQQRQPPSGTGHARADGLKLRWKVGPGDATGWLAEREERRLRTLQSPGTSSVPAGARSQQALA